MIIKQTGYAHGLEKIKLSAARKAMIGSAASGMEKHALRSAQAKLAWLARNTRPELAFDVGRLQQNIAGEGSRHFGHQQAHHDSPVWGLQPDHSQPIDWLSL